MFVSDLRQVGGFLSVLRFPSPIKLTSTIELKYYLEVALNTLTLTITNLNKQTGEQRYYKEG